jgi:TRAP-type C4-dicarboxylate transport system permease small subunit
MIWNGVRATIRGLTALSSQVAVVAMVALLLVVVTDVVTRTVRGRSLPGLTELSVLLLVVTIFMGLAYAEGRRSHVSMNLVTSRLPPRVAKSTRAVARVIGGLVMAWVAYATAIRGLDSFRIREFEFGLRRFPVWPARLVIPASFAIFLAQMLLNAVEEIMGSSDENVETGPRL